MLFPGCAPALTPFLLMTTRELDPAVAPFSGGRRAGGGRERQVPRRAGGTCCPGTPRPMLHPVAAPASGGKGEVRLVHP